MATDPAMPPPVRDTARVWAAGAAAAVGVVVLHTMASHGNVDLLQSSPSASLAWADIAAVACAAIGAVLAGSALYHREQPDDATKAPDAQARQ